MAAMLRNTIPATLEKFGKKTLGTIKRREGCDDFLVLIEDFDHHDELYALTDLKQQQITWHRGIKKWLGYEVDESKPLPMDELTTYVHPYVRTWFRALMAAGMLVLADMVTRALRFRFVINAPLIKADGNVMLVKIITMSFDYDEKWKGGTFLQSFFIVGPYQQEPVGIELYDGKEKLPPDIYQKVAQELVKDFRESCHLTDIQLQIVQAIRELQQEGMAADNKNIAPRVRKKKGEEETPDNVKRYLSALKTCLLKLIHDATAEATDKPFFPEKAETMKVIGWFEESGIIPLLEITTERRAVKKLRKK